MGNGGSGWSMSIWPRHIDRTGQDGNKKSPATVYVKRTKPPKIANFKRDEKKFEAGLTKMMGSASKAEAYIKARKEKK